MVEEDELGSGLDVLVASRNSSADIGLPTRTEYLSLFVLPVLTVGWHVSPPVLYHTFPTTRLVNDVHHEFMEFCLLS